MNDQGVNDQGVNDQGVNDQGVVTRQRLAVYQYAAFDGDETPKWYRRCVQDFDPNTRFELAPGVRVSSEEDTNSINTNTYLYIHESPQSPDSAIIRVDLKNQDSECNESLGDQIGEDNAVFSAVKAKTSEHHFFQEVIDERNVKNIIREYRFRILEDGTETEERKTNTKCETAFDTNSTQTLKTWNPLIIGEGFAWMQTHPFSQRIGELHIVSKNSQYRDDDPRLCNQVIIELSDYSVFPPNSLWRAPLHFDYNQTLYFCQYFSNGVCNLYAKNIVSNESPSAVIISDGITPQTVRLPQSKFAVLGQYLLMSILNDDQRLLDLTFFKRNESNTLNVRELIDSGLRFPDLKLFLSKDEGESNNVDAYWISGNPNGWTVKKKNLTSSD